MAKNSGVMGNVSIPTSKPSMGKGVGQHITGKVGKGMLSMGTEGGGDKGLGQGVKTVKSNPIQGKGVQKGNSAMGSGGVIGGMI